MKRATLYVAAALAAGFGATLGGGHVNVQTGGRRYLFGSQDAPRAATNGSSGGVAVNHKKRGGWSCAEAKRRARRRRNQLRAKGQHRKAVR